MARKNRREEIIKAARTLFYAKGYENTSVRDILDEANVSNGTFFHQFESKQALLMAVIDEMGADMAAVVAPVMQEPDLTAVSRYQKLVAADNAYRASESLALNRLGEAVQSDWNMRLLFYLYQKGDEIYCPALTQIIHQGIEEGVFDVALVPETAELWLSNCRHVRTAVYTIWQDRARYDDPYAVITRKLDAAQTAVDRLVGAPLGELLLLDKQAILNEFDTLNLA
ncbi:MAG: TetR/AcrR family transcriptional regulator [Chloroflexota bacterium]